MNEFVFAIEGCDAFPTPLGGGAWDVSKLHGSAVAALLAHFMEALPTSVPMMMSRLAVEFLRPVPIAPLNVQAKVLREGKKIQVCAVELLAGDVLCARATAIKTRTAPISLPEQAAGIPALSALPPEHAADGPLPMPLRFFRPLGLNAAMEFRIAPREPGHVALWVKLCVPFFAGSPTTPLIRAVIAADFVNFAGGALDPRRNTCINSDLTFHIVRLPEDDWLLADSHAWLGPQGIGVGLGSVCDRFGAVGHVQQSLVIEERAAPAAVGKS